MSKINSDYIKNNVACIHCNSNKLKRSYKKEFKSPINEHGIEYSTKIEWRQFNCSKCNGITNVLNTEDHILTTTESVIKPLCGYEAEIYIHNLSLFLSIKHKENKGVIREDLSDENILNIQNYFNKFNIYISNIEGSVWNLYFNNEFHNFNGKKEALEFVKKILNKAGCEATIVDSNEFLIDLYLIKEDYNNYIEDYKKEHSAIWGVGVTPQINNEALNTKINESEEIVKKCSCLNCSSNNLTKTEEKEFKKTIDENGDLYNGIILRNEIFCNDCKEVNHILLKEDKIISHTESYDIVIPFSGFRYAVELDCDFTGQIQLWLFFKDDYKNARDDDIRSENILGFEQFFNKINIEVYNEMENCWSLNFDNTFYSFKNDKDIVKFLKKILNEAGAYFDKSINF